MKKESTRGGLPVEGEKGNWGKGGLLREKKERSHKVLRDN